jgi:hypothetical protein
MAGFTSCQPERKLRQYGARADEIQHIQLNHDAEPASGVRFMSSTCVYLTLGEGPVN